MAASTQPTGSNRQPRKKKLMMSPPLLQVGADGLNRFSLLNRNRGAAQWHTAEAVQEDQDPSSHAACSLARCGNSKLNKKFRPKSVSVKKTVEKRKMDKDPPKPQPKSTLVKFMKL